MVLNVSQVRFTAAPASDQENGFVGHVCCVLNSRLLLDGIALRRTQAGRHVLSFPERRDRHGVRHPIVRPLGVGSREAIEVQIFEALRREGVLP